MESESSETNLVIITKRDRFKIFCKLYWRILVILTAPMIFIPIIFIKDNDAYRSLYVFLVMIVYWVADVMHPAVIALAPVAISSIMGSVDKTFIYEIYVRNDVLDCITVMMLILAIEHSNIHRRIALKVLLVFGCSHYRLSFLLFFSTMFLSMWLSNILSCGIMMPLVKAILTELEKMGILEIYETIGKARQKSQRHEQSLMRPSEITIFYFLGIAYSSSIGDMATMMGIKTSQIFKIYCETLFPVGPKIEFPHYMLLNLPGVLVMETLLYIWMNFYFLGMFRHRSSVAIGMVMTEEEAQYIDTLLATQYQQMGKIQNHEFTVATIMILAGLLEATISTTQIDLVGSEQYHDHIRTSSPCVMCVILLFILPVKLECMKFFKRSSEPSDHLPTSQTKACLNWDIVNREIKWSVPFILAGSSCLFDSLRDSGMTEEFAQFLLYFSGWPPSAFVFIVVLFCGILTQFAPNSCVVYGLLPSIAKISVAVDLNPHYLMMAATLGSSLPFHLVYGSAVNAMVCEYVHIPPWKMIKAGTGPSLFALVVVWFTATVWSTAIWTDINLDPEWADINMFNKHNELNK